MAQIPTIFKDFSEQFALLRTQSAGMWNDLTILRDRDEVL